MKLFHWRIKQNKLINKKHKKVCRDLNYTDHLLILTLIVTGWVSISVRLPLVGISVGIASSAITTKLSLTTAGIKKCRSIIKKKKNHDKIVLLAS